MSFAKLNSTLRVNEMLIIKTLALIHNNQFKTENIIHLYSIGNNVKHI